MNLSEWLPVAESTERGADHEIAWLAIRNILAKPTLPSVGSAPTALPLSRTDLTAGKDRH